MLALARHPQEAALPFQFYPDERVTNNTNYFGARNKWYPDEFERRTLIPRIFASPAARKDFVVSVSGHAHMRMHYSCVTLRMDNAFYYIDSHILAHSRPDDLRAAAKALLARLGLKRILSVGDGYYLYNPERQALNGQFFAGPTTLSIEGLYTPNDLLWLRDQEYSHMFDDDHAPPHNDKGDQRNKGMLTSVFLCVEPKWGWPTPLVGEDARRLHAHAALAAIVMHE
jgi:hypothetical protein